MLVLVSIKFYSPWILVRKLRNSAALTQEGGFEENYSSQTIYSTFSLK
jgi:hypothetical protein